jgi:hypothetical protein
VEPRPPGHHVYDRVLLPRLGLPLIATMLAGAGHEAAVYCEMLSPVDLSACLAADLTGISSTTSTAPPAYRGHAARRRRSRRCRSRTCR